MRIKKSILITLCAGFLLTGCSGFLTGKTNRQSPTALNADTPSHLVQVHWSQASGARIDEKARQRFTIGASSGQYFIAGTNGRISSIGSNGALVWSKQFEPLSTGVEAGNGLVLVGNQKAELIALSSQTGEERWRQPLYGNLIATPLVHNGVVVAISDGGAVEAFDSTTGELKWGYMMLHTSFAMAGAAKPVSLGNDVLVANDWGQVIRLNSQNGEVVWGVKTARSQGSSLLANMLDIDSEPLVVENDIYVASITQGVSRLSTSGQLRWRKGAGNFAGLAYLNSTVISVEDEGRIVGLSAQDGQEQWENRQLLGRGLTKPAVIGNRFVVGDFEGYIHLLEGGSGHLLGSTKVANGPFLPDSLVQGNGVLLQTLAGQLYRISF